MLKKCSVKKSHTILLLIITLTFTLIFFIGLPCNYADASVGYSREDFNSDEEYQKYLQELKDIENAAIERSKKYAAYELTISVGESLNLLDYLEANYENDTFYSDFKSVDPQILSSKESEADEYDHTVIITGKKEGTAYLTDHSYKRVYDEDNADITMGDSIEVYNMVKVNVTNDPYFKNSSRVLKNNLPYIQLTDGGKAISAALSGTKASVKYQSSDTKVFKVSKDGKLTPVNPGIAILTATVGKKTYKAEVCVISKGLRYDSIYNNGYKRKNITTYTVTGLGKCKDKKIVIGAFAENSKNRITSISENAFKNSSIKSIMLPNTLREIEESAFDYCKNLKSITLPDSLRVIKQAFYNSGITELDIPEGVTTIDGFDETIKKVNFHSAESFSQVCRDNGSLHNIIFCYEGIEFKSLFGTLPKLTYELINDIPLSDESMLTRYSRNYSSHAESTPLYQNSIEAVEAYERNGNLLTNLAHEYALLRTVEFHPGQDSFNVCAMKANLLITFLENRIQDAEYNDDYFNLYNEVVRDFLNMDKIKRRRRILTMFGFSTQTKSYGNCEIELPDGTWYNVSNSIVPCTLSEAFEEIGSDAVKRYIANLIDYGYGNNPVNPEYSWDPSVLLNLKDEELLQILTKGEFLSAGNSFATDKEVIDLLCELCRPAGRNDPDYPLPTELSPYFYDGASTKNTESFLAAFIREYIYLRSGFRWNNGVLSVYDYEPNRKGAKWENVFETKDEDYLIDLDIFLKTDCERIDEVFDTINSMDFDDLYDTITYDYNWDLYINYTKKDEINILKQKLCGAVMIENKNCIIGR